MIGKRSAQTSTVQAKSNSPTTKAEQSVEAIWQEVLTRLADSIGAVSHRTWLAPTRLQAVDGMTATVEVPHALAQRWIERHLLDAITTELGAVTGQPLMVQFVTAAADVVVARPAVVTAPAPRAVPLVSVPAVEPADLVPASPLFSRRGGVIRRVRRDGTG